MTRKEAIEAIKMAQAQVEWDYPMDYVVAFDMAIEALKQPKRVHAYWIGYATSTYNGIDDFGEAKWIPKKFFRCGICRKGTAIKSRYCPNCGAKMDEEK